MTETLFLLDRSRGLKRRPDVAFVSAKRWSLKREVPGTESWDVIPDLAVEVISKTNSANAVARKIESISGRSEPGVGDLSGHEQDLRVRLSDERLHPGAWGRTRWRRRYPRVPRPLVDIVRPEEEIQTLAEGR